LSGLGDLIHHNTRRTKTVYRYQNKCGLGPYMMNDEFDKLAEREDNHSGRAPAPDDDFPNADLKFLHPRARDRDKTPKVHFGFEKPAQARKWFGPRARNWLRTHGFTLKPVKATMVWRGGHQVMFVAKPGTSNTPNAYGLMRAKLERAKCGPSPTRRSRWTKRGEAYHRCARQVHEALEQKCLPKE
jgi:hypothetical protein